MRIISGNLRGRRFNPPDNFKARPTTDFAKENLFNVLNNHIDFENVKILDLFSGTGSITYEFASRGCRDIVCVERNFHHWQFIARTIRTLELDTSVRVIKGDAFRYLQATSEKFDIIFADPPFDLEEAKQLPDLIFAHDLLRQDGFYVQEHSGEGKYNDHPHFWQTRSYGSVNFTFFKH